MKIIKPLNLAIMHRNLSLETEPCFVISVLIGSSISETGFVNEQKMWGKIANSFSGQVFDSGMPKTRAEVLAVGNYYPKKRSEAGDGTVRLKLTKNRNSKETVLIDKRLIVRQDRHWQKTADFWFIEKHDSNENDKVALDYSNGFGGTGFDANPDGKGFQTKGSYEVGSPLPNLEYQDGIVSHPNDVVKPAALSAIPGHWSERTKYMGDIDDEYLKSGARRLPKNFDMRYFNEAPEDQAFDGYFEGDEEFEIENMARGSQILKGRISPLIGRCFVKRHEKGVSSETTFEEVQLHLDTLWLIPDEDLAVTCYRGIVRGVGNGLNDVEPRLQGLLCAFEDRNHVRRTFDHYHDQYLKRTNQEEFFKYALDSTPISPIGMKDPFESIVSTNGAQYQGLMHSNATAFSEAKVSEAENQLKNKKSEILNDDALGEVEKREFMAAFENASQAKSKSQAEIEKLIDAISPGLSKGEPLDLTKLDLSAMEKLQESSQSIAEKEKNIVRDKIEAEISTLKSLDPTPEILAGIERLDQLKKEIYLPPILPRFDLAGQVRSIEASLCEFDESLGTTSAIKRPDIDIEWLKKSIEEAGAQFKKAYTKGAHLMLPARSPHKNKEIEIASRLIDKFNSGQRMHSGDYAFIDLSGRNLRGIDLSESYLECVNFRNADLQGANLKNAILAGANLEGANLSHSNLSGSNLGSAILKNTNFDNCDLRGTELGGTRILNSKFTNCMFESLILIESEVQMSSFDNSLLENSNFIQCDFEECSFRGVNLGRSNFVRCAITAVIMEKADLGGVNFVESKFHDYNCQNTKQANARYLGECKFAKARFDKSDLTTTSFRGARGTEVSFDFADISSADFTECQFPSVSFRNCIARNAVFVQSEIRGSSFAGADIMATLMSGADLFNVSFENANMFGVDFGGANFGGNNFIGGNLERTLISEWQPN